MAKKRSNGEGNLRHRADGRWELTIMDGFRDDGRRSYTTFYGKTQKEVKEKAKAYEQDKAAGLLPVRYTFSEWADMWYEHHKDNIAPTTQETYKYTLRILKEGFARRRLADIKPKTGKNWDDQTPAEVMNLFYGKNMQGQISQYVNNGGFIKFTSGLNARLATDNDGILWQEDLAEDIEGATEDVYIIELERNVPQRIRMFIWLEGQDVDCVDSVNSSRFAVNIEFAGGTE